MSPPGSMFVRPASPCVSFSLSLSPSVCSSLCLRYISCCLLLALSVYLSLPFPSFSSSGLLLPSFFLFRVTEYQRISACKSQSHPLNVALYIVLSSFFLDLNCRVFVYLCVSVCLPVCLSFPVALFFRVEQRRIPRHLHRQSLRGPPIRHRPQGLHQAGSCW